jgi:D-3-phosphoglycerate dehydrogenase
MPGTDRPAFDPAAFAVLEQCPLVEWEFLPEHGSTLTSADIQPYDAIVPFWPRITEATLAGAERLQHVARFGAGLDTVDVAACERAGVLVTNTPDGVRRPVATTILAFILALSHRLLIKDRLTREGRWHERMQHMGEGLIGKTVGMIGFGSIAREAFRLLRPLDMRFVATSRRTYPEIAAELGVREVSLDELLAKSDFVCLTCPLTPETRGLIGVREIGLMKPGAYLINVARGPVADEPALYAALRDRRIAGAALDVFEQEPVDPGNPILKLENVVLAPHSLCWTDECYRLIAESAFRSVVAVAEGRQPDNIVNPGALGHARWRCAG